MGVVIGDEGDEEGNGVAPSSRPHFGPAKRPPRMAGYMDFLCLQKASIRSGNLSVSPDSSDFDVVSTTLTMASTTAVDVHESSSLDSMRPATAGWLTTNSYGSSSDRPQQREGHQIKWQTRRVGHLAR